MQEFKGENFVKEFTIPEKKHEPSLAKHSRAKAI